MHMLYSVYMYIQTLYKSTVTKESQPCTGEECLSNYNLDPQDDRKIGSFPAKMEHFDWNVKVKQENIGNWIVFIVDSWKVSW